MTNENTKALYEKRQEVLAEMKLLGDKVTSEKRNFSPEENTQVDNLDRMQEELCRKIETLEKVEKVNNLTRQERKNEIISSPYHQGAKPFNTSEERQKAYAGWFYHGTNKQKPEYWRAAERQGIDIACPQMRFDCVPANKSFNQELRGTGNQVVGTASAGGDVVFDDLSFARNIDIALKHYGQVLNVATVIDTPTGAALPYPLLDDTSNKAEVTAEAAGLNAIPFVFAQVTAI